MNVRKMTLLFIAVLTMLHEPAFACGDKFLIVGRGSRFQRAYVALHPASLLVVNENVTGGRELQTALKLAGHSIRLATAAEVPATLAANRFDFVLADFKDIDAVERTMPAGVTNVALLPVIDASSKTDVAAATKQFKCLLGHGRSLKNSRRFLAEIDAAMDSKLKAAPLHCDVK